MRTRLAKRRMPVGVCALFMLVLLAATSCQGSNPNVQSPRPRSREAAGDQANLPFEEATSGRVSITSMGGELEFREARLTVPRGAVPEPIFFEISIPD